MKVHLTIWRLDDGREVTSLSLSELDRARKRNDVKNFEKINMMEVRTVPIEIADSHRYAQFLSRRGTGIIMIPDDPNTLLGSTPKA